jgi:hypothetical protein
MMQAKRGLGTVLLGGVLLVGLPATPSAAAAKVTCRSGRTVFRRPGLRVFVLKRVYGNPSQEGSHYKNFYLCGRGARRPRLFDAGAPFTTESVSQYKLVGNRLGFVRSSAGVQSGAEVDVGWVQFGGPVKQGTIWATEDSFNEEEEQALPKVPSDELDYAIAPDGASRRKRSRKASSEPSSGASTFSATHMPSRECRARYTTLMPPRPMTESIR